MIGSPRPIHVERTADPAVLRWVCHDAKLNAAPAGTRRVPPGSALGQFIDAGEVFDIAVRGGDVFVRSSAPDRWSALAPTVQAELIAELDRLDTDPEHWLLRADGNPGAGPSILDVQETVDRAAGALMAGHGGAMVVAAVEATSVRLEAVGACDGCRQSDDTLLDLVRPAVRAAHPDIVDVVLARADAAATSATQSVTLARG